MEYIAIPDTDLTLCPIGLGTVRAGLDFDGLEADRIFDAYLSMGGNLIDTAHVYSDWITPEKSRSERVIGDWLHRGGKRKQVVLMTKGGHPDLAVESPDLHNSRMTKQDMQKDLDGSLAQLKTDYIDVYFYHRDDMTQPVEALIETMQDFVRQGKIRYYACSNWDAARMREADSYCRANNYRGFVANQALFNIGVRYKKPMKDDTMRSLDDDMRLYHGENPKNLLMPYKGICGSYFHKLIGQGVSSVSGNEYDTDGNRGIAEIIKALARRYNASISQVLLGYFRSVEFPCLPLFGTKDTEHLADAMNSLAVPFCKADYSSIIKAF